MGGGEGGTENNITQILVFYRFFQLFIISIFMSITDKIM